MSVSDPNSLTNVGKQNIQANSLGLEPKVVNLISRFKASLDGEPDPASNLYTKHYVPFCLHNPMLAQIAIYTAACFLNDTCPNVVDDTTAMSRKGDAICMLETHLRTMGSTTDEAIAGVMQLILNEWYWGGRKELEAHLGGLREMVRSRGGLANLGLGGLLAKLIIMYCYPGRALLPFWPC